MYNKSNIILISIFLFLSTSLLLGAEIQIDDTPDALETLSTFVENKREPLKLSLRLDGSFKQIMINGVEVTNAIQPNDKMVRCLPSEGWKLGLNKIKAIVSMASGEEVIYEFYLSHFQTSEIKNKVAFKNRKYFIDNKPFFPLGIYAVNDDDIPLIRAYGFNVIQSYQKTTGKSEEVIKSWMDQAHRNNLYTLLHYQPLAIKNNNIAHVATAVVTYMTHPALFCHYLFDEPHLAGVEPKVIDRFYYLIKGLDPFHPVLMSTWRTDQYRHGMDMELRQSYHGRPDRIFHDVLNHGKGAASVNQPVTTILATHDSAFGRKSHGGPIGNSPSAYYAKENKGEVDAPVRRAEKVNARLANPPFSYSHAFPDGYKFKSGSWLAIVGGSPGLLYWLWQHPERKLHTRWGYYTVFHKPELRERAKKAILEIKALSPLWLSLKQRPQWTQKEDFVLWEVEANHRILIVIVNLKDTKRAKTVALSHTKGSGALEVFGEGRTVSLSRGHITDTWAPWQTHLYIMKSKSIKKILTSDDKSSVRPNNKPYTKQSTNVFNLFSISNYF